MRSNSGWSCQAKAKRNAKTPPEPSPEARFIEITSDGIINAGRTAEGRVFVWGYDEYGWVTKGHPDVVDTPTEVPGLVDVVQLRSGRRAYALRRDGNLVRWGKVLGLDCFKPDMEPWCTSEPETWLRIENVSDLAVHGADGSSSDDAACVLLTNGSVRCFGDECSSGRCGTDCAVKRAPTFVPGVSRAVGVSMGAQHACAWDTDGRVFCWGLTRLATVSQDHFPDSPANCFKAVGWSVGMPPPVITTGVAVPLPPVRWVSAGKRSTCAVDRNGHIFCWGIMARREEPLRKPKRIEVDAVFVEVVHDAFDEDAEITWALDETDSIWCWGGECGATPIRRPGTGARP